MRLSFLRQYATYDFRVLSSGSFSREAFSLVGRHGFRRHIDRAHVPLLAAVRQPARICVWTPSAGRVGTLALC